MSDQTFGLVLHEPRQAHAALAQQAWPAMKTLLESGKKLWLSVEPLEDARTLQQNKFMWGVVLKQISEQAQVGGLGADAEGWHRYYKVMFLGYRFRKVRVPGKKRPSVTRELRSTKDLSVKAFAEYIDQVQAHAATTFGVEFTERLPQELRPEMKKAKAKPGEILETT